MKPLISIIVPVYNVEAYLDRCVESIVNQTYSNIEIILVDDGSTDNCPAMCDECAAKDSRIKVIHKENGGQASARNVGLDSATGDFIGFVDSDDFIDLEMYNVMYHSAVKNNADIIECTMKLFYDQSEQPVKEGTGEVLVFSCTDTVLDFIRERHFTCTVPNLLVKSSIAKNVKFDDGMTHEDILWPYRAFVLANRVAWLDSSLYFYYQRQDSTMNKRYSEKRFDALDALELRAEYIKNDFPNMYHVAVKSYLGSCMYQYQYLCRQPKSDDFDRFKEILYNRFCSGDRDALFSGLNIKYRIWYKMFIRFPNTTSFIRNSLKIGI